MWIDDKSEGCIYDTVDCTHCNACKTCWNCSQRIGEECGIDGHEVYPDSKICGAFEEF